MTNLINFTSEKSGKEYSVDLHIKKMGKSGKEVMFITITTLTVFNEDFSEDYTVILNGLPTVKNLKRACGSTGDVEAAKLIIKTLKEKAIEEACEYWNFNLGSDDEWCENLDNVLEDYIATCG